MAVKERKEIKPQAGGQERFVRSNVDVCFFGGVLACGKSAGAVLSVGEYLINPKFRALFLRRNLDDQKRGGGLVSQFSSFYDRFINTTISESPRATAQTGAWVDFTHIADEKYEKVVERFKGAQYDFIYFDELTSFEFKTFTYLMTRNRGEAGIGGKFRATTNPKKSHWIRTWLDWYIDPDGFMRSIGVFKTVELVNPFDPQQRIWKNSPRIRYEGSVHERLTGYATETKFDNDFNWMIYHIKSIHRQQKQNEFYEQFR